MNQKSSKCVLVGLYSMEVPFLKCPETTAPMYKAVATVKRLPPARLEQSTEGLAAGTAAHLVTAEGRRELLGEVHMGQCSANRR